MAHPRAWGRCLAALVLLFAGCARLASRPTTEPAVPPAAPVPRLLDFEATAYSIEGRTAAGTRARAGIVAADPAVLPLGSRIRVHGAGAYSGEYVVEDTGRTIDGREIDVYLANDVDAKKFGRRRVKVEVLRYGYR